jgi:hypothetical protein
MSDNPREDRDETTRAKRSRGEVTFVPAGLLPDFKKNPDYEYRWVRAVSGGQTDNLNINARMAEGWEPVQSSEHPEIKQFKFDKERDPFNGFIEHGGLILCKASKEKVQARKRYYDKVTENQMTAVDNDFMREQDKRMPLFRERTSTVTRGSKPE